jgi:hypothetical protein
MMEGDRQLHHALDVPTEILGWTVAWPVPRQGAPHVLENFVSVEEMDAVEEVETPAELIVLVRWQRHNPAELHGALYRIRGARRRESNSTPRLNLLKPPM